MKTLVFVILCVLLCGMSASAGELYDAVHNGDVDKVKALIAGGIDVNASGDDNHTPPLIQATIEAQQGANPDASIAILKLLLANGANVNARSDLGATALYLAVFPMLRRPRVDVIQLLLSNGADVNARTTRSMFGGNDPPGATPLHMAAAKGLVDIVEVLLASGADVNAKAGDGSTPLRAAIANNQEGVVKVLKKHKARM